VVVDFLLLLLGSIIILSEADGTDGFDCKGPFIYLL